MESIREAFSGRTFVHAVAGDLGVIVGVDGDWLTVTWETTGTTTDCHVSELRPTRATELSEVAATRSLRQ